MLILGLDPGSRHTGYGLISRRGATLVPVASGRISPTPSWPLPRRLGALGQGLEDLILRYRPEAIALESVYHGVNSKSLIVLAQARGALIVTAARAQIELLEYSPAEVKQAVAGNGRADKGQVSKMVEMLLALPRTDRPADATDALAVAICCGQRLSLDRLAAHSTGAREPSTGG